MASQTVIVDDSDLTRLTYSNGWIDGGSSEDYNRCVVPTLFAAVHS